MNKKFRFSPLTLSRINKFKRDRLAFVSLIIIIILFTASVLANVLANDKPLLLVQDGQISFPFAKFYPASRFGFEGIFELDYKSKSEELKEKEAFVVWPPIRWGAFRGDSSLDQYPGKPSWQHPMGTDTRGRDVLVRMLYGFRLSFFFSLFNYLLTLVFAIAIGGMMGYVGGWLDLIGQRLLEIWSSIPSFIVILMVAAFFKPGIWGLILVTALFTWVGLSYYIRAEFLKNRKEDYVLAAKSLGVSNTRIFIRHILPNSLTPIITFTPFIIAQGILQLSAMDFLGFGVQPPTPSLGELLNQGFKNFTSAWWLISYPGLALLVLLLLFNFIGDGMRKAFDSRRL